MYVCLHVCTYVYILTHAHNTYMYACTCVGARMRLMLAGMHPPKIRRYLTTQILWTFDHADFVDM